MIDKTDENEISIKDRCADWIIKNWSNVLWYAASVAFVAYLHRYVLTEDTPFNRLMFIASLFFIHVSGFFFLRYGGFNRNDPALRNKGKGALCSTTVRPRSKHHHQRSSKNGHEPRFFGRKN